jgi:hypothetical protein
MKVLLYENRKMDMIGWLADTPEQKTAAFLALFKFLDESWSVYCDLDER